MSNDNVSDGSTTVTAQPSRPEPFAADGYQPVRELFEQEVAQLGAGGGAFAAYVRGEPVLDLWGGRANTDSSWSDSTLATIMSSTKGLAALCVQILNDRGLLDIDAPMAEYWPEFAQAGKQDVLVRHILDHTVGLVGLPQPERLLDWTGEGWDRYEEIAEQLAASPTAWPPGTRISYHAITFGWLTGELVRRVTGRTIGTFFRDEVAQRLDLDAWIGTPSEQQVRMADVIAPLSAGIPQAALDLDAKFRELRYNRDTLVGQASICMPGGNIIDNLHWFMNQPRVRSAEIAAANGSATAHALARVYAMLAAGGELDGARVVSPESVKLFSSESFKGPQEGWPELRLPDGQLVPPGVLRYGLGYSLNVVVPDEPPVFGFVEEAFGHAGAGGQIAFCDPVNEIAVGFVRSHLTFAPNFSACLIEKLYDCTAQIGTT